MEGSAGRSTSSGGTIGSSTRLRLVKRRRPTVDPGWISGSSPGDAERDEMRYETCLRLRRV